MDETTRRRLVRAGGGVAYLAVLAALLLTPSPGTAVTVASMAWIALGLVLWIRAIPSPSRRRYKQARRSHAEQRHGAHSRSSNAPGGGAGTTRTAEPGVAHVFGSPQESSMREMTIFWISVVPPPMEDSLASRQARSTGKSLM